MNSSIKTRKSVKVYATLHLFVGLDPVSAREPEKQKKPSQEFSRPTPDQARTRHKHLSSRHEKREEIKDTGQDITKPHAPEKTKADDALAEAFRRADKQKAKREQEKDRTHDDPGRTMAR